MTTDPHATDTRADGWRNVGLAPSNFGDEPKSWWQWKRPERRATGSHPTWTVRWRCVNCGLKLGDGPFRVPAAIDGEHCRSCYALQESERAHCKDMPNA